MKIFREKENEVHIKCLVYANAVVYYAVVCYVVSLLIGVRKFVVRNTLNEVTITAY